MFKKILVVEDIDSINLGVITMLEKSRAEIYSAKYCDDAWLKIQNAAINKAPFDLLISDLSFTKDHRETNLEGGLDLIKKVREQFSDIKIIVYSIENRYSTIKELLDNLNINGYISKGRNSINELDQAIESIHKGEFYLSKNIAQINNDQTLGELHEDDLSILKLLSEGLSQSEISNEFKRNNSAISSMSSIEKRINKLKVFFNAKNTTHLISIVKDMGLI